MDEKQYVTYDGLKQYSEKIKTYIDDNTVLRRDNEENYKKIEDTLIPRNGELCLVDTAKSGLRVVCGDGVSTFKNLSYIDDVIVRGYLLNGEFYDDVNKSHIYTHNENLLYLNRVNYQIYVYDSENGYSKIHSIPAASKTDAGIMKLYDELGENTDGTITQKLFTTEINKKVEMEMDVSGETLNLFNGFFTR